MSYLSACLIHKDENSYLREWVSYHRAVGVEKFFIYDNGSKISPRQTLSDFISRGEVEVVEFPGHARQVLAYRDALSRFGAQVRWMTFTDTDEFIVPKSADSVAKVLRGFEDFGGVVINWANFGSSGHETRPTGRQIENFTFRCTDFDPAHYITKSIVQPARTKTCVEPHFFEFHAPFFPVNMRGERVENRRTSPDYSHLQINHYYTRSRAEFMEKIARGRADGGRERALGLFDRMNQTKLKDTGILRFVPLMEA
jgi:hypothetical protein